MSEIGKRRPQDLVKAAEGQGWRVKPTRNGWMLYPPDRTRSPVLIHRSPSDHRWWANAVSLLRKSGLDIP